MSFCPLCRTEYRLGFKVCSDCHVNLVDALPEEEVTEPREPRELQWTYFQSVLNDLEADLIAGLLQTSGIPTLRKYPGSSGIAKIYLGSSFGVDLFVPEDQLKEAQHLLHQSKLRGRDI